MKFPLNKKDVENNNETFQQTILCEMQHFDDIFSRQFSISVILKM